MGKVPYILWMLPGIMPWFYVSDALTIAGETTFGAASYEGRMQMSGKMDGQQVEMSQTYSGKRVGDCTASR